MLQAGSMQGRQRSAVLLAPSTFAAAPSLARAAEQVHYDGPELASTQRPPNSKKPRNFVRCGEAARSRRPSDGGERPRLRLPRRRRTDGQQGEQIPFAADLKVGARVERASRARGLIVRNLGDCIAICPPYIMTEGEVDTLVGTLARTLDDVYADIGSRATPVA